MSIIPIPQKIKAQAGDFTLAATTRIVVDAASRETGEYLAQRLRTSTGYPFHVGNGAANDAIQLTTSQAKASLGREGYQLEVTGNSVVIRAPESAGLFYGVQTLLQLLPPEIFAPAAIGTMDWKVPCVEIEDLPRFKWRGFMLDVSRHFFNVEEVKKLLDAMALHKLNTFHWHLTDDQGWRIEIGKYPNLTAIGAWRDGIGFGLDPESSTAYGPDGRYGGFYTQDDIRRVVAYARSRHITVVPEIEMPGHSMAALSGYPEFSCVQGPFKPALTAGIFQNGVYCVGNDGTFAFLQDILAEVIPLFDGRFVHVGGDEVKPDNWQNCPKCRQRMKDEGLSAAGLEGYFIRRIEAFIRGHGKTQLGWSEICNHGGLTKDAAVMDWIGCAEEAAGTGHDVVMAREKYCYLDQYQSRDHSTEPPAHNGFLPVDKVYRFEPVPSLLPPKDARHILGPEGCLWTELIASLSHVEYMTYPRLSALAEVGWAAAGPRDWDGFSTRLQVHYKRLDQLGITYRHYPYNLAFTYAERPSDA